jgi:hypothetical protein
MANFAIMMRHRGKDRATDIPLSSAAIKALALEAMSRDLDIAGLIGQVLVAAINKDMIQKILADEVQALGLSPQTVWKKRIHEALATPWKAFARSPLGLASILGQAADQLPFRRPKRSRHRPLAIAPTGQLVGVAT